MKPSDREIVEKHITFIEVAQTAIPTKERKHLFTALTAMLGEVDEKEALSKCPHGKVTMRQYCRDCSMQVVEDEYNHARELQDEISSLTTELGEARGEIKRLRDVEIDYREFKLKKLQVELTKAKEEIEYLHHNWTPVEEK